MSSPGKSWFGGGKQVFRSIKKTKQPKSAPTPPQIQTLNFNLKQAVRLPEGEDLNEWLALNVSEFYNQLSMLYATITEFCTPEKCPIMCAGHGYKYRWRDDDSTELQEVSAPEYANKLFLWVTQLLDNEAIFPSTSGTPFPDDFIVIVKNIMKRFFRIDAHCYYHHLDNFQALNTIEILHTSFKHFIFFSKEFNLIPADQLEPLRDFIDKLISDENSK